VSGGGRAIVGIITPALRTANTGNWHTAARWARMLSARYRVRVLSQWRDEPLDLLIALHARRSADSIAAFAAAHPDRALIVVLTGTDLYRDLEHDAITQRSLELATSLVVLNELGADALPPRARGKASVILQSAPPIVPGRHAVRTFDVAVVGHLREVKDPQTVMRAAALLPADSRVRIRHAGRALEPTLDKAARATERAHPRYRWLGDMPRTQARRLMRDSHLLLHPSKLEGGAQVVIEAIQAGTPVIASDCDGNAGLLGRSYPGLFPVGDAEAAAELLRRAEIDPGYYRRLRRTCRRLAAKFSPRREARSLLALVHNSVLRAKRRARK
jgi:putative glycosyltransferase (TIGR04348 family)